jgi:hypothetical protein
MTSWIPLRNVGMCGCNKAAAAKAVKEANVQRGAGNRTVAVVKSAPVILATVNPSIWGPSLWKILHIAALRSGSRSTIPHWRSILEAMMSGLPCPDCSDHYNAWYRSHPLRLGLMPNMFQGAIIRWILEVHNDVNRRTGKAVWNTTQLAATYGGETIATAKALVDSLNGVIGARLSGALNALLRTL